MATPAQIAANRENARKSTGPSRTERTRFNGLKHGLRAEQVVLPGEDSAEFEAERAAWFDDWGPRSHTRAALVERAAVAAWRLRRCVRAEAARMYEVAADVAHEFDTSRRERVACALHLLARDPGAALARLRSDADGLDCLIGLWDDLARAAAAPGGWASRADHHDRLLALLGHSAGPDPQGLEIARASRALLAADDPAAASALRDFCAGRIAELRRERSDLWDPAVLRRRMIDAACAPTSKEAQLLHRYEMAHEQSLRSAIRGLLALERSDADLPGASEAQSPAPAEAESAARAESEAGPGDEGPGPDLRAPGDEPGPSPPAHGASAPAARRLPPPDGPVASDASNSHERTCVQLASVGAATVPGPRPGAAAGPPGRRGRPGGANPDPRMAPRRP